MDKVRAFRGFRYSDELKDRISKIICPPYDIIDEKMQIELFNSSELNYVRVVLSPNGHKSAKETLRKFIESGIIKQDEREKIYFVVQRFDDNGTKRETIGLIALVSKDTQLFIHEETRSRVIEDRIELLELTGFNTCPIMLLSKNTNIKEWFYRNRENMENIFSFSYRSEEFGVEVECEFLSTERYNDIIEDLSKTSFLIADGHHRFKAIQNVYEKKNEKFFMAYITDTMSGIYILPILREVEKGYEIEIERRIKSNGLEGTVSYTETSNINPLSYLMNIHDDFIFIFEWGTIMASIKGRREREKNRKNHIQILHDYILKDIPVKFTHNLMGAIERLKKGERGCIIIPRPISEEQIWALVKEGEIFPPKSTYFWPKVPSGLVLNKTSFSQIRTES